jgi:predicted nuclease of restriction endonuclease-like (RecB) superfamily
LSWSAYLCLIRIENPQSRDWYAKEAAEQGWSVRALDRQISTLYYERLLSSQDQAKTQLQDEAAQNIAKNAAPDPRDFIRDPYVLEFLGAPAVPALYEKDLEQGLLDQLQTFLWSWAKALRLSHGKSICAWRAKTASSTWCSTTTCLSALCWWT